MEKEAEGVRTVADANFVELGCPPSEGEDLDDEDGEDGDQGEGECVWLCAKKANIQHVGEERREGK